MRSARVGGREASTPSHGLSSDAALPPVFPDPTETRDVLVLPCTGACQADHMRDSASYGTVNLTLRAHSSVPLHCNAELAALMALPSCDITHPAASPPRLGPCESSLEKQLTSEYKSGCIGSCLHFKRAPNLPDCEGNFANDLTSIVELT